MREAILRVDGSGLLWIIWRLFSRVLIVRTTSLSDCKVTLGREPVSRNVWWIRVNTLRDGIVRSGKRIWYSWTAAHALPSQNPYTKCISQYCKCEKTKGIFALHKSPSDCSAHGKVTGLTRLVDRAGALDKYDVTTAYSMSTPMTPTLFSGHYLRNRSTLDIGVLGYIGIV